MTTVTIAPVRKTLTVKASPARAFEVFTAAQSRWWPPSHTILKSPFKAAVIEPRAGGRWYHLGEDGSTCDTGFVRVWEPPSRLVLVWQLDAQWRYDKDLDTEVEVNFVPEGPSEGNVTRVTLEHRHIERMRDGAETARAAVDGPSGWTGILEEFRKSVDGE
jgi:uncharacterized protein YndB with AHSA1/START domain